MSTIDFEAFFQAASGKNPFPYQIRLGTQPWPTLIDVPTGLGKTAAVVVAWLFKRLQDDHETPRRLVYCLPMRVLVDQTRQECLKWIENTRNHFLASGSRPPSVHILMGGEVEQDWDESPEACTILIGTQDQLLSRALNRGYAMSRYRWPIHFSQLHNDALWVMDETQLMGVGVETTAQLAGMRKHFGCYGPTGSIWMSATLDEQRLHTIDHDAPEGGFRRLALSQEEVCLPEVAKRVMACKPIAPCSILLDKASEKNYAQLLAQTVVDAHKPGTLTLVVVNRVKRAQQIFQSIAKLTQKQASPITLALVHGRMRPYDRKRQEEILFSEISSPGKIVVATQTVEAGVDVSAATLFTELAPWSSLVQRFGRCNRYGEQNDAQVHWIDIPDSKSDFQLPYDGEALRHSRENLSRLTDVGPQYLGTIHAPPEQVIRPILRRKDLLELFDTTPDLAGNDLDVSRYIREGEDLDVQVYWRRFEDAPAIGTPGPRHEELCAVGIGSLAKFLKNRTAWHWNALDSQWEKVDRVRPGQIILLPLTAGGYDSQLGWTGEQDQPEEIPSVMPALAGMSADPDSILPRWVSLAEHTADVVTETEKLAAFGQEAYASFPGECLITAAWWHDIGKAHEAFQNMLLEGREDFEAKRETIWAKSNGVSGKARYSVKGLEKPLERKGFRHELASALAWLQHNPDHPSCDLISYLIASHHGKVRMSIRSLPNENLPPEPDRLFARGIWDGDPLPAVEMGQGRSVPACRLSLSVMSLGEGPSGPSWLSRTVNLRNQFGPFKLAYLEMMLRIADWRGSEKEKSDA